MEIHRFTGIVQIVLLSVVTLGMSACSSIDQTNSVERQSQTLEMTADSEAFVRSFRNGQLSRANGDAIPLQVSLRVAASTDASVCETGELYGPYTVTDGTVVGGQTLSASPKALRLANMGDMALCLIVTSPVDASIDISADAVKASTSECTEAPANIDGYWHGSFSCTSSCEDDLDGFVGLSISQDGNSATYTDFEADYEGIVCGNSFEYTGSGPGYTEAGTFVLNADGTASKTSTYTNTGDGCQGSCSDPELERYEF